jgi:hypothetical protein
MAEQVHRLPTKFELGADITAERGKPKMRVGDMLTDEDTFTIIANSVEQLTKTEALNSPHIMKAHFGNEQRIKRVQDRHKKDEKMKANKKPIGKKGIDKKKSQLFRGSDDNETNTNNGGSSGEQD